MKTSWLLINLAARAACARSSRVRNRTRTLVSTATTALFQLFRDGLAHLWNCLRTPCIFQTSKHVLYLAWLSRFQGSKKYAARSLLDGQHQTWLPIMRLAYSFRQHNLAFRGKSRCFHCGKTTVRSSRFHGYWATEPTASRLGTTPLIVPLTVDQRLVCAELRFVFHLATAGHPIAEVVMLQALLTRVLNLRE